jgi:hypothetical protein
MRQLLRDQHPRSLQKNIDGETIMSDLTSRERRKLEKLFGMSGGYVLDFSNRTFAEFFDEEVGRNIYDAKYGDRGASKANHLRVFWEKEPNLLVAKSIRGLMDLAIEPGVLREDEAPLVADCQAIHTRLSQSQPVADIDAIRAEDDDRDFETVAKAAREAIEKNQPEQGLDRLHTFMVKFVRKLCEERGLGLGRNVPLNGLFGAYVKKVRADGLLGSLMAEHILKASISNLEQFNHVRNHHSLAHDNPVLTYDEALFIYNNVASTVRFVKSLEDRWKLQAKQQERVDWDIPF